MLLLFLNMNSYTRNMGQSPQDGNLGIIFVVVFVLEFQSEFSCKYIFQGARCMIGPTKLLQNEVFPQAEYGNNSSAIYILNQ